MGRYWRPLILLLAVAAAFGGSLRGSFHFDDYSLFADPLPRIWNPLQTRPLTYLTFSFNRWIGGTGPFGYHLVNLLLHTGAVLMLFYVLRRLIHPNAALIAAGLFAVHPMQSEAEAYVFARATLLCTLLCLVAWNEWLRGKRWTAVIWFALALLAKEECVTFPIVLLLLLLSRRSLERIDALPLGVMFGLSALAGLRAALATKLVAGAGAGFSAGIGPVQYLGMQGWAILRYMRLLVFPWGFTVDPDIRSDHMFVYALAWFAVLSLAALASLRFRNLKEGFWAIAGLVLLIPSSTIFPAADLAADRRMYLPMIAFAAMFGIIARSWPAWIPASVLLLFAALSAVRMEVWRTERSLWSEAVRESPHKVRPLIQLARVSPNGEALDLLTRAKALAPHDYSVASELGVLWLKTGQDGNALSEFGRALAMKPHDPQAISNRGAAFLALHQEKAASHDFEAALRIDPCLRAARMNLGKLGGQLPVCATEK